MIAGRLFGTDGIRGVANAEPMTAETALRIGRAVAGRCLQAGKPLAVIGRDPRLSGGMLESALTAGLCSAGVNVHSAGVLPTPGIAYLTRSLAAGAGVVVSASHNRFEDNGIKVFADTGLKLTEEAEQEIEESIRQARAVPVPPSAGIGTVATVSDAEQRYSEFLKSTLPAPLHLQGVRLALDCANGAAYRVAPHLLRELGASVTVIGAEPDGTNINDNVGALHPARVREVLLSNEAHLGIALDGDADRVILVDERGDIVDGDEMLMVAAVAMRDHGEMPSAVVGTVMSNMGLELALRGLGMRLLRTAVGDRHVVDEMVRSGCPLGGEPSGHLVFLDAATTGDGLLAALRILAVMDERQQPLSALRRAMQKFPQAMRNVRVTRRVDLGALPSVSAATQRAETALDGRGRLLVRFSGTEPVVRVMVEGESAGEVDALADEIAVAVREAIGA
jgi:phosphoglucosamine mutase